MGPEYSRGPLRTLMFLQENEFSFRKTTCSSKPAFLQPSGPKKLQKGTQKGKSPSLKMKRKPAASSPRALGLQIEGRKAAASDQASGAPSGDALLQVELQSGITFHLHFIDRVDGVGQGTGEVCATRLSGSHGSLRGGDFGVCLGGLDGCNGHD